MEKAARRFFELPKFAVVGASRVTDKYGYKIMEWYHYHNMEVTPVNPTMKQLSLRGKTYRAATSVTELELPHRTALSFVTQPHVTKKVLQEAKLAGVRAVWLQPGSFDDNDLAYAEANFAIAVGGYEGKSKNSEGWCVLVDGEKVMAAERMAEATRDQAGKTL